jgi:hypothetical protein
MLIWILLGVFLERENKYYEGKGKMNTKTKFIFPQCPKESFLTEKTNVTRVEES